MEVGYFWVREMSVLKYGAPPRIISTRCNVRYWVGRSIDHDGPQARADRSSRDGSEGFLSELIANQFRVQSFCCMWMRVAERDEADTVLSIHWQTGPGFQGSFCQFKLGSPVIGALEHYEATKKNEWASSSFWGSLSCNTACGECGMDQWLGNRQHSLRG